MFPKSFHHFILLLAMYGGSVCSFPPRDTRTVKNKKDNTQWWRDRGSWNNWIWTWGKYSLAYYLCEVEVKAYFFLSSNIQVFQHSVSQSVQSLSRVRLFATPWIAACQASLSITNSRSSLRLTSIESVMPSSHLILGRPLLLLPLIHPSIRVFSNESTFCMRWPKY